MQIQKMRFAGLWVFVAACVSILAVALQHDVRGRIACLVLAAANAALLFVLRDELFNG